MPQWIDPAVDPEGAIAQLQDAWDAQDAGLDTARQKLRRFVSNLRRGRVRGLDGERGLDLHTHSAEEIADLQWLREDRRKAK